MSTNEAVLSYCFWLLVGLAAIFGAHVLWLLLGA